MGKQAKGVKVPAQREELDGAEVVTGGKTIQERALAILEEKRAQRLAAQLQAAERFNEGTLADRGGSLEELLARPVKRERHLVEGLIGTRHNVVLAAQYKTGKTTLGVNLIKALVDGKPFLERAVTPFDGRVAWWNGEMDDQDFHGYVRPLKVRAKRRIQLMHLRGARVPLLDDHGAEVVVKWLRDNDIRFWGVDSWRRLCVWNGINENDNEGVEQLTERIDRIKDEAGCDVFFTIAHTGRAAVEEGEERARGATALDDWVDARWVLTKSKPAEGGDRFLAVTGRGVSMEETQLTFNQLTGELGLGSGNRRTAGSETLKTSAMVTLKAAGAEGMLTTAIAAALDLGKRTGPLTTILNTLAEEGVISKEKAPRNGTRWTWN